MNHLYSQSRILAIDPCYRGFGFAVLEGNGRLVDWGVACIWAKSNKELCARVEEMILRYRIGVLVVEVVTARRCSATTVNKVRDINNLAASQGLPIARISRSDVQAIFGGIGSSKQSVAEAVADLYPELTPFLPRGRKAWMSEDDRMNIFDATALGAVVLALGPNGGGMCG